jgi:hypothetical protein
MPIFVFKGYLWLDTFSVKKTKNFETFFKK